MRRCRSAADSCQAPVGESTQLTHRWPTTSGTWDLVAPTEQPSKHNKSNRRYLIGLVRYHLMYTGIGVKLPFRDQFVRTAGVRALRSELKVRPHHRYGAFCIPVIRPHCHGE